MTFETGQILSEVFVGEICNCSNEVKPGLKKTGNE